MGDNFNPDAPAINTVKVTPGGATFKTISAAIDSIKDASLKKQYLVAAGPGTYSAPGYCLYPLRGFV
jgi:pectin methylesterase-like acyl-CoA thioesterase